MWNFAVRDDGVVPLPSIRYRTPLDAGATADAGAGAGAGQELTLTVDRAPDSRPSLQISYDDGKTWTPVTVRRKGTEWAATLKNPASGFVSLHAKAAGVDQTVIRAYAVKSRRS
ncbi:hypothetical protein ACQPZP_01635 [Spirillospora sp. CA-142024]|uniref:hypothetical protein n=1 Tax=Spirillospora sp. CA-142024 TaxID=3240036 RepID=UPI003D8D49D1